jgi:hypothetical protein
MEHARIFLPRCGNFLQIKFRLSQAPEMNGEGQAFEGRNLDLRPLGGAAFLTILWTVQFRALFELGGLPVQFFIELRELL